MCGPTSGGISDLAAFDPADFNFTQAVDDDSTYSAIALREGATAENGAKMFGISFQEGEAERTWKQSRKGASVRYDHEVKFQANRLSKELTSWLIMMDAASSCAGVGLVIRHNSGEIFVLGERFVNAKEIPRWKVEMADSDGTSGKVFDDFNGGNIVFKGAYTREACVYTGDWSTITDLM
ncbi:hypothetical protein [Chitinophaga jiangningensis]|uniref:hypothetical protein n=1 Tax=Chitinophaga jiangningensis TaxID=1419482 RepID=UPI00116033D7|nr:hypothetical protein [Chitinophaga jiangningensis]